MTLSLAVLHILITLADGESHGYAIMQDVAARTGGALRLGPGTLYGSIKRMLHDGLIEELDDRPHPDEDDARRKLQLERCVRAVVAESYAACDQPARRIGMIRYT